MNPENFRAALKEQGMDLTEQQMEQFALYFQTLVEWNEKMNLTALTAEEEDRKSVV